MRLSLILLATTTLSACSGAGPATVGGTAVPAAGGTTTTSSHTFANPTETKTYAGIGGFHSYKYYTSTQGGGPNGQGGQLYQGDATTARNSGISLTYNPRDAIFDLTVTQPLAGVSENIRFQDPAHRTNFGGASEPQGGVPDLTAQGVNFLQVGTSTGPLVFDPTMSTTFATGQKDSNFDLSTFFYQKPGTSTKYVTFAGFVRNKETISQVTPTGQNPYIRQDYVLERGAFAYGERTGSGAVPKTGSGTYNGAMIATMVYNPLLDTDASAPTYFQWLHGTSTTKVNFAANTFTLDLAGTVLAPTFDVNTTRIFTLQNGATFTANGSGRVDMVNAGGFLGQFQTVYFTQPNGTRLAVTIGGSSIDGTFFGPGAEEVGGGFRIVGGVPDERIDILGAFTGKQ